MSGPLANPQNHPWRYTSDASRLYLRVAWASAGLPVLFMEETRANKFAHATHATLDEPVK